MRNRTIIIIIAIFPFLALIQPPGPVTAKVPYKNCEICHVLFPGMKDKNKAVQDTVCVNCHSNTTEDTIKIMGNVRVPVVYNTVAPANPLAGGNFFYVTMFGMRKGHNVAGISPPDARLGSNPPGYESSLDPSTIKFRADKPLTCAGSNGCHGNRNIENSFAAIMGAHHGADSPIDGSTTARSYRYLKNTNTVPGVVGLEDEDWGRESTPTKHNEYSPSINLFCKSCHGEMHGGERDKPWFRHPVGVALPDKGEYKTYTQYDLSAPVARDIVPAAPSREVKAGRDIVVCTSCHMGHASPYDSALRWDFKKIFSAKGKADKTKTACFICHAKK